MTLEERLERLAAAAAAARDIGLEEAADPAEEVVGRARERVGFAGTSYVIALAGGTGVGKSSLLNALAGETVSEVRAVRPTTDEPIAWVAEDRRQELAALLAWLGVRRVSAHRGGPLRDVAVLDLPDLDSVRTEHRATVDGLLPRLDAVVWVVDPEKYDDERLHAYLRARAAHAARMRFVLNKLDRVPEADRDRIADDLRRRLEASGIEEPRVAAVSATTGEGIADLRADLNAEVDAKALVVAKLETDALESAAALARSVGVEPGAPVRPLLSGEERRVAVTAAVAGALEVVDPPGVGRQVGAAVLQRARRTGGSLLGRTVGLLGWLTGHQRRSADPAGYLRDWRRRGTLGRAVNPVHAALVEAAGGVPAASRPGVVRALGADRLEAAVSDALDRVAREAAAEVKVPGSLLWLPIGAIQLVVGAVFLFAVAWYVTLFVSSGSIPVATIDLPALGPLPLPLVLLAGSVLISAVLGMILAAHAGWIGRRHGARLADRVRVAVDDAVERAGFAGLDRVEAARRTIGGMT